MNQNGDGWLERGSTLNLSPSKEKVTESELALQARMEVGGAEAMMYALGQTSELALQARKEELVKSQAVMSAG